MNRSPSPIRHRAATLFCSAVCLAASVATAQTTMTPAASTGAPATAKQADEDVAILSPFEVTAGRDHGYAATQTLSGTRHHVRPQLSHHGPADIAQGALVLLYAEHQSRRGSAIELEGSVEYSQRAGR